MLGSRISQKLVGMTLFIRGAISRESYLGDTTYGYNLVVVRKWNTLSD